MNSTPSRPSQVQEAILADLAARRGYLASEMASLHTQIDWVKSQPNWEVYPEANRIVDRLEAEMASLLDRDDQAASLEANIREFYGA